MNKLELLCRQYIDGVITDSEFKLKFIQLLIEFDINNLLPLAEQLVFKET